MKHIATALLIFFALVLGPISPVAAAAGNAPTPETVATGLDNPRGLVLLGTTHSPSPKPATRGRCVLPRANAWG